jgi:glycosyltransferase involved in cell wall biosynthesis
MKFVLNTNYQEAGAKTVWDNLAVRLQAAGHSVVFNDWDHYDHYDVAMFMSPDSKIREVKAVSPKTMCGLFDPKANLVRQRAEARAADFLVVSSLEQKDFFLQFNANIFIYYMFHDVAEVPKVHANKEKIIIGYHGNRQHLHAMKPVTRALDVMAKKYDIEFWAIYNIKKIGKWNMNLPKVCPVKHIQWSPEERVASLSQCDIGIAPSILPLSLVDRLFARPWRTFVPRFFNWEGFNKNDYLLRFKYSNNPGRLYVFSQMHIPVITDFTPSSCELVRDNHSGLLVASEAGWERALEKMITDAEFRKTASDNLKKHIDENFSIDITFNKFVAFVSSLNAQR